MHDRVGLDIEIFTTLSAPVRLPAAFRGTDFVSATAARADRLAVPPRLFQPVDANIIIRELSQQLGDADGLGVSVGFGYNLTPGFAYL